jgi:hypothetical protein
MNRVAWIVVAAVWAVAMVAVAAAVVLVNRDDPVAQEAPSSSAPATHTPEAAPKPEEWPPPLPSGVPTTGENAWRLTWKPDADAEQRYRADLLDPLNDVHFGDGYVRTNLDTLVRFGYGVCRDYYRGVPGKDEYDHIIQQLVGDPRFQPTLSDGDPSYGDVRSATASGAAVDIELAANRHFCMNIDPWGESY